MSCRIIFEDEIDDQNLNNTNSNQEIIKEEVEDNCSQDHTQDTNSDFSEQLESVTQLDPQKPLINQDHLELFHGFINSPIQSINIVEVGHKESIAVKEELQAVCEGLDDSIESNEEHSSDDDAFGDLKPVNLYDNYLDIEDIQLQSHHLESDSEDDVPLMEFKTQAEQEVSENKRKAKKTNRAPVAQKSTLDTRRTKLEGTIAPEIKVAAPKIKQNTQERTSTPFINIKPRVQNSINNIALDTNCRTNSDQDLKRFKCDTCQSSFRYKSLLRIHILLHTGEKPYKCDVCQRSFRLRGDLGKHIQTHTSVKPYKCDVCQRSFRLKFDLRRHKPVHTGEKPYKCEVCQRSFNCKNNLRRHIRIHTGEKRHKCNVCQRSFNVENTLRRHIRIHTGEKPHKCDLCQRSFTQKGLLSCHIRIHTGVKPYKCDVCQRSFRLGGDLTKHIRIHTVEKTYKCDVCQRGFAQKSYLKRHIRIHGGEKKSHL